MMTTPYRSITHFKLLTALLCICFVLTPIFSQYEIEWQISQDEYEYGHLYFDLNNDGTNEITKELWNGIAIFDGADNFNEIWSLIDENYEILTLYEVIDVDSDGSREGLFISKNIYNSDSFRFQLIPLLGAEPVWITPDYSGTITHAAMVDLAGDSGLELVFGTYVYDDSDNAYSYSYYIIDGESGAELWSSVNNSGYIVGPYPGDADGDGSVELVSNHYNMESAISTLFYLGIFPADADANQDGEVDILDVVSTVACILIECPDGIVEIDLNFDASLDVSDIVILVNAIIHGLDNLPWNLSEKWQVEQDFYEYGNLYFDITEDGFPELTKQLNNAFTVYNGSNNWAEIWTEFDTRFEYLTLYELFDFNNDEIQEALVIGTNSLSDYQVQFMIYDLQGDSPVWETEEYDGYTSWISSADLDNDFIEELVYGVNDYNPSTGLYSSQIHVVNGLNGTHEWSSGEYDGFFIGPYTGDLDADGDIEILVNLYDITTETYEMIVWGYHPAD